MQSEITSAKLTSAVPQRNQDDVNIASPNIERPGYLSPNISSVMSRRNKKTNDKKNQIYKDYNLDTVKIKRHTIGIPNRLALTQTVWQRHFI